MNHRCKNYWLVAVALLLGMVMLSACQNDEEIRQKHRQAIEDEQDG